MQHPLCLDPYPGLNEVISQIQSSDTAFTDLETAILTTESGPPTRDTEFFHAGTPEVLHCLDEMGFDLLALSNNHAWDLGTAGVLATRNAVAASGFGFAGTGADIAQASTAGFSPRGQRVALVAMASGKIREGAAATSERAGVNELRMHNESVPDESDVKRNLAAIAAARDKADCVLVYLHNHQWGDDMSKTKPWARKFARACIDAGADVFASHGAPLLHGLEVHRGKPIFHGLGSLVFHSRTEPGHYPPEVWESAIVQLNFAHAEIQEIEIIPIVLNELGDDRLRQLETRGRPRIARGPDAARILNRFTTLSAQLGTDLTIVGERAYLRPIQT